MTNYEAHIRALVRHYGLVRGDCGGHYRFSGASYPNQIEIVRVVKSPKEYAAALHEIGHTQTFHRAGIWSDTWQGYFSPEGHFNEETLAWNWAREHALWWSKTAHAALVESYAGHRKWALRKVMLNV